MKPVLIVDVDGVLLRWSAFIPEFVKGQIDVFNGMRQKVSDQVLKEIAEKEIWMDFDEMLTCDKVKARDLILQYNNDYGDRLPAYADSKFWIPHLSKRFDIIAVTCFGSTGVLFNKRMDNLRYHYGDSIKRLISLPYSSGKYDALLDLKKEYENIAGFVDDRLCFLEESYKIFGDGIWHLHMIRCQKAHKARLESPDGRFVPVSSWMSASILLTTGISV